MFRTLFVSWLCCVLAATTFIAGENPDYNALMQRGHAQYFRGDFPASEASFLAALKTLQRNDDAERAAALEQLGDVYVNEDELVKAERVYLDCLAILRRTANQNRAVIIYRDLGALYSLQRRDGEALKVLKQALKLVKADSVSDPSLVAQVLNSFGVVYFRQRKYDKAERYLNEALQLSSTSNSAFDTQQLIHNLGAVYYEKHDLKKAEEFLTRALQMTEAEVGPVHPDLTFGLSALGNLYRDTGRYADSEAQYQRALKILDPHKSDFETRIARLFHSLSVLYTEAGRKAEAEAALSQASIIARRNIAGHDDMAAIVEAYSLALKHQGKPKEAEALQAEARRARVAAGLVVNLRSPF